MDAYYHRYIEESIVQSIESGKVILLLGARQTGKSTLLNHLLPENAVNINLQEYKRRLEVSMNPGVLTEIVEARNDPKTTVFIDEVQKVPELLEEVQYLYDKHKGSLAFLLTGSSSRKLKEKSANLLPGRTHLYRLYPVSQIERGKTGLLKTEYKCENPFPAQELDELLIYGSLPGILSESPEMKGKTLESYAELYIEEEIRRENLVKNIGAFSNFLQLAALESGKTVSLTKLSNEIGLSINGIKNYYQILVDTHVGYFIPAYSGNSRKRLLSTPKFYLFDNGIRNACAKIGFNKEILIIDGGNLFEHWVGLELIHKTGLLGRDYGISYYRTVSGVEIDFILKTPKGLIPVEVKWTENPGRSDAKHIENFIEAENLSNMGYIICRCREPRRISEHVMALPWSHL